MMLLVLRCTLIRVFRGFVMSLEGGYHLPYKLPKICAQSDVKCLWYLH